METKRFPLRDVLSVATGRLLTEPRCPDDNGIEDLYKILDWMTNDSNFTHQLSRAGRECQLWLLRWFPELAEADALIPRLDAALDTNDPLCATKDHKAVHQAIIAPWLESVSAETSCKTYYDVPRIPADDHDRNDPVAEAIEMVGADRVIVVPTPED